MKRRRSFEQAVVDALCVHEEWCRSGAGAAVVVKDGSMFVAIPKPFVGDRYGKHYGAKILMSAGEFVKSLAIPPSQMSPVQVGDYVRDYVLPILEERKEGKEFLDGEFSDARRWTDPEWGSY